ncbi:monooxygenase [Salinimicrobium marinum]|uniref:Monooxygenase n=1 Tax=Salinimicrobium marinum TaxID=680283 RepID=A0A918SGR9_9FLAO|nr:ArsO family NAD(P)H-dependent flavin-containing monooxygenase [Salinimicrobium marinum]GHA37668.1 monooxygenase [Salinimicrobium marinum]
MYIKDVIIIGGGQSALACGYYLRRTGLDFLILDKQENCGGSWQEGWDSLTLFSPAEQSSLPGWLMPKSKNNFPHRDEVIHYLCKYEQRYKLAVERPVEVLEVTKEDDLFKLKTNQEDFYSKAVISATGIWEAPFIPEVKGGAVFQGEQLHASEYKNPDEFDGQKVLVVGEGNSGAQILADVSKATETTWATLKTPDFLPDDVDGRVLFNIASAKYYAKQKGEKFDASKFNLGDIVMVPSVKDARERGVLNSKGKFLSLYEHGVIWENGEKEQFDSIIWCTGFHYATRHLQSLAHADAKGKIKTNGTRALEIPGLWMVGYGGWTGYASATLIGIGRSAKKTTEEIQEHLKTSEADNQQ